MIRYRPYGNRAILLQWDQRIDDGINAEVTRLAYRIESQKPEYIQFVIPAYCSLTVGYDPLRITYEQLCVYLEELRNQSTGDILPRIIQEKRLVRIPVCYEDEYAPDLPFISREKGISADRLIDLHTSTEYRVFMLGFLPGFPYMGPVPEVLRTERKENPRYRVPAGSVGLAGLQTGIYPIEAPGGWQLIGRTPLPLFATDRDPPFLLQAGDRVRFERIDTATFLSYDAIK